ncbi:MAG: hypothetical protein ACLPSW_00460 [Roseiarcus sp.]
MTTRVKTLPQTMMSPEAGETLRRAMRPFVVAYEGESVTVDLPGYYPEGEGDGVHVGRDMSVVDDALRSLKERHDGAPSPARDPDGEIARRPVKRGKETPRKALSRASRKDEFGPRLVRRKRSVPPDVDLDV